MRRLLLIGVLAFLAGCGGGSEVRTSAAASLAPKDALALIEIDGDLDSTQWQAAQTLLDRFPDGDKLLAKLADEDLDLENDLDPAFGDQVVVVVLAEDQGVALTQPDDEAKLKDLLGRKEGLETRLVRGWTAIGKPDDLSAYEQALGQGTLEGDEAYLAALAKLPEDALVTGYVNGSALTGKLGTSLPGIGGKLDWMAVALTAEDRGVRLAGTARMEDDLEAAPLSSDVLDRVPGDVLGAFAFGGGRGFTEQLQGLDQTLGIDLEPVAELLEEGGVLWVQAGLPIPRVTLVLESGDIAAVDELVRTFAGGMPIETTELDGQPAKGISLGPATIRWAKVDGRVVVTTATSLLASGETLAENAAFQEAREAAGMPDETNGFLYVNLQQVVPLVEGLFGLAGDGLDSEISRNLRPLASLLGYATGEGREMRFDVFLEIR